MQQSNQNKNWFQVGTPQCGILFGLVGVAIALSLIFLGFWKTVLIALFFGLGYVLGAFRNKKAFVEATISTISKKDE
ncbi:MAG: DUF2273 domain-containing protein [Clostridia bacterium]|nr:DUF2273 domain-containing protein [Clostridia bacterium]